MEREKKGSYLWNPLQAAFDQEFSSYLKYYESDLDVRFGQKKQTSQRAGKKPELLLNLWKNYGNKVDRLYFEKKLLSLGDHLFALKDFLLGGKFCYHKLLQDCKVDYFFNVGDGCFTAREFEENYFGNLNSKSIEFKYKIRALLGAAACYGYQQLIEDSKLQSSGSVAVILRMLQIIQLTLQIALKEEKLFWMVYNGTIHMYSICKNLVDFGHSDKALVYALWSCVCMESSVPLMTLTYLGWRTQLYVLVCQCYYNCNLGEKGESFARRAVLKVQELQDIEEASFAPSPNMHEITKQCKLRLMLMIFKRNVFESRRRPKGILRPKNKPILKDIMHNPWPRTPTERMLTDFFPSRAAQMLAILEALSNPCQRLLHTAVGVPDLDDSIMDVYSELFFAATEIIAGGGGTHPPFTGKYETIVGHLVDDVQLVELALQGKDTITVSSFARFVMLTFNLENFELFETYHGVCHTLLTESNVNGTHLAQIKELELCQALFNLHSTKHRKRPYLSVFEDKELGSSRTSSARVGKHLVQVEELYSLAKVVESCFNEKTLCLPSTGLLNSLVDATLYLWSKVKTHFSRVNALSSEVAKLLDQDGHFEKWLQILVIVQQAMMKSSFTDVDSCCCSEASTRLALIYEILYCHREVVINRKQERATSRLGIGSRSKSSKRDETSLNPSKADLTGWLYGELVQNPENLLKRAKEVLQKCIESIHLSYESKCVLARKADLLVCQSDETSGSHEASVEEIQVEETRQSNLTVSSLYLELLILINRIDHRISAFRTNEIASKLSLKRSRNTLKLDSKDDDIANEALDPKKNFLLQAVKNISALEVNGLEDNGKSDDLLQDSFALISKGRQAMKSTTTASKLPNSEGIPPPPNVVYRGPTFIIFEPAPYTPSSGEVKWYRLYVRSAAGNNVKARLSDTQYKGSGKEALNLKGSFLTVTGLEPNERYVAAVAAFDAKDNLVGGAIGQTTKPILACYAVPYLNVLGYLAKVAYERNAFSTSQKACQVLFDHFVEDERDLSTNLGSINRDFKLTKERLKMKTLKSSSSITIRYFVQTVLLSVDQQIIENSLFCDSLSDHGPLRPNQIARIKLCEKLALAIKAGAWLNDSSICLQAVIMTYGLLAPMLHQKILCPATAKVLLNSFSVLQELYPVVKQRKQNSSLDNLQRMVLNIVYYIAKNMEMGLKKKKAIAMVEKGMFVLLRDAISRSDTASLTSEAIAFTLGPEKRQKKSKHLRKGKPSHAKQLKTGSDISPTDPGVLDMKALDAYLRRLSKEVDLTHDEETGDVLSGVEDSGTLHAVVSTISVQFACREVFKFKRRTLFLQHFVRVVSRAFEEGYHDQVAEWTKDVTHWLLKRNDIMLGKTQGNKFGPMLIIGEEERNKKYSVAVVEYGKAPKKSVLKNQHSGGDSDFDKEVYSGKSVSTLSASSNRENGPQSPGKDGIRNKQSPGSAQRQLERIMGAKKNALLTDQEKETKEAIHKIQNLLPEYWQTAMRRRRLRVVFLEELPWRSQMNYIYARSLGDQAMTKLRSVIKSLNLKVDGSDRALDTTLFYLPLSGMLTTSWAGSVSKWQKDSGKTRDRGGKRREHVKDKATTAAGAKGEKDNSRAVVPGNMVPSLGTDGLENKEESKKDFHQMLQASFMNLRKAVVLAHRANNYKLAHNACVELFNAANALLRFAFMLKEGIDPSVHQNPLGFSRVRQMLWRHLYIVSDCLLDFLERAGEEPVHQEGKEKENSFVSPYGSITDCRGGMSLKFDLYLDNSSLVNLQFVKKIVLLSIEFLYYEEKWERLVDLTSRFQIVTGGRYSECILPTLIVAQKRLKGKMDAVLHLDLQQSIDGQKVPSPGRKKATKSPLQHAINIGVMIDPFNSNLYNLAQEGHKRSALPVDTQENYLQFYKALESKQYTARALEHSRKLFFLYLMAKCGNQEGAARLRNWTSSVSFAAEQVNPPSDVPVEYEGDEIISKEEVEYLPLPESCQGTVMSSFQKTVEMLLAHQQKGLSAQAMHELGNLLFHGDNIREAYHYWAEALDLLLKKTNCIDNWQELIDKDDETVFKTRGLLKRAGIWGVLLGGILAAKIARYVHTSHLGKRAAYCRLAANLFMALLTASLPHPSMHISYATYDIGPGHTAHDIIPGIDLFSDYHRADGVLLLSAVLWTCEEYLRNQFYIQVLPLLTIAQYLSTHICRSVELAVRVKLMRVTALSRLGLFAQAIGHFSDIIHHRDLPKLPGNNRIPATRKSKEMKSFKEGTTLLENIEVLHIISNFHPSNLQMEAFGTSLCLYLALTQAEMLVAIAKTIYEVPESYLESVEPIRSEGNNEEKMASAKHSINNLSPKLSIKKHKSKSVSELTPGPSPSQSQLKDLKKLSSRNIKEYLLSKAEVLLGFAYQNVDIHEARKNRSICQLLCLQLLLRGAIAHERLLVHTAVRHIFDALQLLSSFRTGEQYAEENSDSNSEWFCRDPFAKLDSNIWLMTRLALAKELRFVETDSCKTLNQLRGTVDISGSCRLHTEQGLMEADVFDSVEYRCSFLYIHATEDLKFGEDVQTVLHKLQVIVVRMSKVAELSDFGFLLQIKAALLKADLSINVAGNEDDINKALTQYHWIETSLLKRCELMGVDTEQSRRAPVIALLPSYSMIIPYLVKVKVRLARIRGSKLSPKDVTDETVEDLHRAIHDVEIALDLAAHCQSTPPQLSTELHDTAGLLKLKALLVGEDIDYPEILSPFLQSVKVAEKYVMDLGQLRQLYNNISIFAFCALQKHDLKTQLDNARFSNVEQSQSDSKSKSHRPSVQQQRVLASKKDKEEKSMEKQREMFVKMAWIAVRAAGLIAKAQKKISVLTGESKVNAETLPAKACSTMPLFLIQDLVGSDRVTSNSDEKGCYVQKNGTVNIGDYLDQSRDAREIKVSWLAIINLWASQMRTLQYSILGHEKRHSVQVTRFAPDSDFQRFKFLEIHRFLRENLEVFEDECCPVLPLEFFLKSIPLVSKSPLKENLIAREKSTSDLKAASIPKEDHHPSESLGVQEKEQPRDTGVEIKGVEERSRVISAVTEKTATRRDRTQVRDPCKASDYEIAMQWTSPQLEFAWEQTTPGPKKMLLFAINAKGTNATTSSYGFAAQCRTGKREDISECISSLHHDLLEILHLAEADLAPAQAQFFKSSGSVQASSVGSLVAKKKRQIGKVVQMPTDREENIKELLKKAMQQIDLVLCRPSQEEKKDLPFPVTVQHVASLESLFNPSYGYITKTTDVFYQWLMNLFGLK